uniref:Uncharacterized protein n=2 Tax=Oryza sativa subsp. japonica TaxID=39947 RepID=Q339B7_ORYSJ|nr:hypothetical protein LOC_Os10g22780 [Oryza sativa Japonica Group]
MQRDRESEATGLQALQEVWQRFASCEGMGRRLGRRRGAPLLPSDAIKLHDLYRCFKIFALYIIGSKSNPMVCCNAALLLLDVFVFDQVHVFCKHSCILCYCLHHGKVVIVEHVLATLGIGGMGLLLVLVGPDSVAVLADNEFSAINMGVDDSEPDNEFSAINMGVDDSGGSDIFGFVPAWLDGIIVLIDEIASAAAA